MSTWNAKGQFGEDLWARPPLFWYDTILHAAPADANAVGFAPLGEMFAPLEKNLWFDHKMFKNTLLTNPIKLHCVLEKYKTRKFPQPTASDQINSLVVSPITTPERAGLGGGADAQAHANRPIVSERPLNAGGNEMARVSGGSTIPLSVLGGNYSTAMVPPNGNDSFALGSATGYGYAYSAPVSAAASLRGSKGGARSSAGGRAPAGTGELNANMPGKPDNVVAIRKSGAGGGAVHVAAVNFQP